MPLISKRTIQEIYDAIDIVEIIGKYVELKKSGTTYKGLSPFSNEKTPSFYVLPHKEIFKDFSSGLGGSAVKFLMEHQRMDYPQALRYIAGIYNIAIEEEEPATDFDKETEDAKVRMHKFLEASHRKFRDLLSADDRAIEYLSSRGITPDDILEWQIGYGGNEWQMISELATEKGYWSEAVELGVCWHKNNRTTDAFRHRITIPIYDQNHHLIGFGGRLIVKDADGKSPKYINPKESKIYAKAETLFGFDRAKQTIRKSDSVILVEGYLDVIALHRAEITNAVASCGTALTDKQAKLLRKWAKKAIIIRDGDPAGIKAADRDIDILVGAQLDTEVVVMPDGKDPDDFIREGGTKEQLLAMAQDAIIWRLKHEIGDNPSPDTLQNAVQRFCETLLLRPTPTYHNYYIDLASKAVKQLNKSALRKDFKRIEEDLKNREKKQTIDPEERYSFLPSGVDKEFVDEYGFFALKHSYFFLSKNGDNPFQGTNFILNPLYHIHNRKDDKRLFEIVRHDRRTLIEVPSTYINQKSMFENILAETPGNFYFTAEFTQYHFRKLMIAMGDNMPTAFPLNTLGQQDEGFFAFADGIASVDGYTPVDEHGMVSYKWEETHEDGTSEEKQRFFYLPAFSIQNRDSRSDNDEYENERTLQYRKARCTFSEWCQTMLQAHGEEKAIIGIAFLISSMYRDIFMKQFKLFPLLFAWGEKGAGKSGFCQALQDFFFYGQEPYNLNAGTDVGFFRRLARVQNAINFFDEYTDHIDETKFQALKSSWGGTGREKGVMSKDNRTETTKVRGSAIVAGQYLSSIDDQALTTRSVVLEWRKQDFTQEQQLAYRRTQEYRIDGVSSLITQFIQHRAYVEKHIAKEYNEAKIKLRKAVNDPNVLQRIYENYACLLAHVNLLHDRLKLPFDREDMFEQCRKGVIYTHSQVADSEALSGFWSALQVMIEEGFVKIDQHYRIDTPITLKVYVDGDTVEWDNLQSDEVLYLRPGIIYSKYVEYMNRQRQPPLGKNALHSYMRGRKTLWIGDQTSTRFANELRDRAWVINYGELKRNGYVLPYKPASDHSTESHKPEAVANPYEKAESGDDLPF